MFRRSLDLVDDCGLASLHVFPFSPRPGTPAARMPQVAREVVKERARRLRDKAAQALTRHLDGEIPFTAPEVRDVALRQEHAEAARPRRPAATGHELTPLVAVQPMPRKTFLPYPPHFFQTRIVGARGS